MRPAGGVVGQRSDIHASGADTFTTPTRATEITPYEIARKHCGRNKEWKIGLELLRKKMGATSPLNMFQFFINELAERDHLPDYTVEVEGDIVVFSNRVAYEKAKRYVPRDHSVYDWETDWVQFWRDSGCPTLQSPDGALIGFCKARFVRLDGRLDTQRRSRG